MGLQEKLLRWAYRDGETHDERFRKAVVICISLLLIFATLQVLLRFTDPLILWMNIGQAILLAIPVFHIFVTKSLSLRATEVYIIVLGFLSVQFRDFVSYGQFDMWALGVLEMDMLLMCNCSHAATKIAAIVSVVYIAYITVEQQYPTGVYDVLPKMSTLEQMPDGCRAEETLVTLLLVRCSSFFVDFILTRRFASAMYTEQARIRRSVEMAQKVAEALVHFDLDEAEAVLKEDTGLGGLEDALGSLLDNLRSYRPYLPEALFVFTNAETDLGQQVAPTGRTAMVFTDIQSSTELWEASNVGMRKGMQTHNRVLRDCIAQWEGYEVKTIGDAFMVAFGEVEQACNFALSAQEALYHSEWSEELLRHPLCRPAEGLWNGLRVRMGVHVGEMDMQVNPVTGRADYFGSNVNIAARVEGKAWGGTVAVTADVLQSVEMKEGWKKLGLGAVQLKGVGEPIEVTLLAPRALKGRLERQHTASCSVVSLNSSMQSSYRPSISRSPRTQLAAGAGTMVGVRVDRRLLENDNGSLTNEMVSLVLDAVQRTDGVLVTVASSWLLAGWNITGSQNYGHTTRGVQMAGLLHRSTRSSRAVGGVTVGVATGNITCGRVGTEKQQFVVAIGQCVEAAAELAVGASEVGAFALVTALPGHRCIADDPSARHLVSRVDEWMLWNGECQVFLLLVAKVGAWVSGKDMNETNETNPTTSDLEEDTQTVCCSPSNREADDIPAL